MGKSGVGMPAHALLNAWGQLVWDAFGETPYLVGSATTTTEWRDVDVRVMLSAKQWKRLLPDVPPENGGGFVYPRYAALSMAVSAWGRQFTGLPIDFQFQPAVYANEKYKGRRDPLGVRLEMPARPKTKTA